MFESDWIQDTRMLVSLLAKVIKANYGKFMTLRNINQTPPWTEKKNRNKFFNHFAFKEMISIQHFRFLAEKMFNVANDLFFLSQEF